MHKFLQRLPWLTAIACCWVLPAVAQAQHPPRHVVQPTVTREAGDPGGKVFGQRPDPSRTRRYYIAAEPQVWDYAPRDADPVTGRPLPPPLVAKRVAPKLRYVQYTDESFQAKVIENPRLGILGPTLRGVVGEYLAVTFLNRTDQPLSIHPHGVRYDKDSEGAHYLPGPGLGAAVGPGAKFTYVWHLDEGSGPQPNEPSSKGWLYHSHVNGDEEINDGLIGSIIVTDPRRARPNGTPADVDREMVALFLIFDESGLGQAAKEAAEYGRDLQMNWSQLQEQLELGARHAINGYVFGNLPGLEVNQGERVRWYLFGLGSEADFHTVHWHGLRVVEENRRRTDVVDLLPATMKVADMVADNPGSWLFQCHVADHMMEGMYAHLIVHPKGTAGAPEPAFLGLSRAQQSMEITRAEATTNCAAGGAACGLRLEGAVTVYEAFSVFVDAVRVQVGGKGVTFKLDRRGTATAPEGSFRVKNANDFGVVYGGMLEFEAVLTGGAWLRELTKLDVKTGAARKREIAVPVTLLVGPAQHTTAARVSLPAK